MERLSESCVVGLFSQSARQRITILADIVECHLLKNCSVPWECIYKVISQNAERVLFERLATPRPPPKVVLKSSWQTQQQQQQQQQDTTEKCICPQLGPVWGNSTEDSETYRSRKLFRSDVSNITHVEEKPEFKVDLRIEGNVRDVILKDEERMGQMQETVENLRKGSYRKSVWEHLRKPENPMIFSVECRRILHELGNIKLHELG